MKKYFLIVASTAFLLLLCYSAQSQTYKSAAGLRLGYPWAASYKTFFSESSAFEIYAGYRGWTFYNWISVNGAYQYHRPIEGVDGLQWYLGAGAGVQFWNYKNTFLDTGSNTSFSVQGYLGLDYALNDIPLSITADWVPTLFLNGYANGFGGGFGNIGVRYIFR